MDIIYQTLFLSIRFSFTDTDDWQDSIGQKQPPEIFYKKRCSQKFFKIHREAPVLESLF